MAAISKWPKGQKTAIGWIDTDGKPKEVEASVVRASAQWLELIRDKEKQSFIVDLAELLPKSLAKIFTEVMNRKSEGDRRDIALLLLLEGDAEGASAVLGAAKGALPDRFWAMGKARRAEDRTEELARRRFYEAWLPEREYPEKMRRGGSPAEYRKLLEEFGETSFVRRHRELILQRSHPATDYAFFTEEMQGAGTMRPGRHPKVESCMTSIADSPESATLQNYIEIEFDAVADAPYKAWVYAGACCQETFTFYLQATGLTETHPKTKAVMPLEPGSRLAAPVKSSITRLPKSHAAHSGNKEPSKWGWIQIPFPAGAAGPRKMRLLTHQQGFSLAWIFVSSTRTTTVPDAEVKLLRGQPPAEGEGFARKDPTLLVHLKFDGTDLGIDSRSRNSSCSTGSRAGRRSAGSAARPALPGRRGMWPEP